MKTLSIQIGNSDDKLTQKEWSEFVLTIRQAVEKYGHTLHFFGASTNWEPWQNCNWILVIQDDKINPLKKLVKEIRTKFKQTSVAWLIGTTKFI